MSSHRGLRKRRHNQSQKSPFLQSISFQRHAFQGTYPRGSLPAESPCIQSDQTCRGSSSSSIFILMRTWNTQSLSIPHFPCSEPTTQSLQTQLIWLVTIPATAREELRRHLVWPGLLSVRRKSEGGGALADGPGPILCVDLFLCGTLCLRRSISDYVRAHGRRLGRLTNGSELGAI
jgi:hypothetical protein